MDASGKKPQVEKKVHSTGTPVDNSVRLRKVAKLFEEWLNDSSGYDEQAWPELKQALHLNDTLQ